MMPKKATADIHDTAAAWVARTDRGPLGPDEQRGLEAWLAADRRHMGAYVRAQAAWHLTGRSEIAGAAVAVDKRRGIGRRQALTWGAGALAASVAAFCIGVRQVFPRRFSTEIGEVAQKSLSDGSVVALDTASAVTERYEPAQRNVELERGQALFDVAKDAKRPFVVAAGPIRVKAIGTAFIVNRVDRGTEIVVTEGVVTAWNIAVPNDAVKLVAGQSVRMDDESPAPVAIRAMSAAQVDQKSAWRTGQIILSGETLAYAAAEFNRYNTEKIEIADAALAQKTLVGGFRTSDPHGFAAVAAGVLHAKVQKSGNTIRLTR
jgi:transmembrane sensor